MDYDLKEYSFWGSFGKAFDLYFANFFPMIIASIITQLPSIIINIIITQFISESSFLMRLTISNTQIHYLLLSFLDFSFVIAFNSIFISLLSGYIGYYLSYKKQKQIYKYFFIKAFPLFILSIILGCINLLGFLFLLIPGIFISLFLCLSPFILMIENRNIILSLLRSWKLTKGYKYKIFLLNFFFNILLMAPIFLLFLSKTLENDLYVIITNSYKIVMTPIFSCILFILYFNIRIKKEGLNIEQLIEQTFLIESTTKHGV